MWNKFKNAKGFTLIEIMVSLGIFLIVMTLASNYIVTGLKSEVFISEQATAIQNARRGMEIITKEIRGANSSEAGSYPIETASAQNFSFYCDIDDDGLMEKVKYFLDSSMLKKAVTLPGALNDYSEAAATSTVAEYINNQSEALFEFYDNNYQETSIINNIRIINIKLKVNVTPWRAPNDYYVESDVSLRNLKDNL